MLTIITTLLLALPAPEPGNGLILASHNVRGNNDSHLKIQCIMQQLHRPHQLIAMPWRRAKQEVKQHRIDGYYTAMPSNDMDESAVLSAPLFLENWYWFWRQTEPATEGAGKVRYGVVLGSHQADWLQTQGLKPELEVNDISQLVQLLHIGRIDSIIADLEDFTEARVRLKLPAEQFQQRFLRYVALGVYFSQQRLEKRPGFLRHFNAAAHQCATRPFALSDIEQQQISDLMLQHLQTLAKTPKLHQAVQQKNMANTLITRTVQLDAEWQQQLAQSDEVPALAQQVLHSDSAELLRQWQANYSDVVTEVILMDNQGANVAISRLTSDYWQGDETQFLSVFDQQLSHFIDVVEYDQSTRRFQVKLSVPVQNGAGYHIGVLSIGIDVEHALREQR